MNIPARLRHSRPTDVIRAGRRAFTEKEFVIPYFYPAGPFVFLRPERLLPQSQAIVQAAEESVPTVDFKDSFLAGYVKHFG